MQVWLDNLLKLQSVDMDLASLKKKITAIPLVSKGLSQDVVKIVEDVKAAKLALQQLEKELNKTEMNASTQEQLAFKLKAQSAAVKKADEYQAMLTEMKHAEEKAEALETQGIELMMAIDEKTEANATLVADKKEEISEIETKQANLKVKLVEFTAEVEKLTLDRPKFAERLDEKVLSSYERVRRSKKDLTPTVVSLKENGSCSGCHLKNSPEIKLDIMKGQVVHCQNCSAILFIED